MEEEVKQEEVKEEKAEQPIPKGPEDLEKPLDKMTAPELRALAMQLGFTGVHAMKKEELLGAIKEEHRGKGLDVLMGTDMLTEAYAAGLKIIDTHHELEYNTAVQAEMKRMGGVVYKRFRVYQKAL